MTTSNYTRHIRELDSANHLHPFTTHHDLRAKGPRVITRAEGVYIHDSEGNKILDGMAGLWCVQLGYGNEDLSRVAYDTLKKLSYYNLFFQTTTPYAAELAALIATKTPPGVNQLLFSSSGSEAVDSAIKLIWYYWNLMGKPAKKAIISRQRAYHGSTIGGASLSGLPFMQGIFDLPLPRFHHVGPTPCYYQYGASGETEREFAHRCAKALEDKILELGPENVAAFVGEPVMGAGGLMTPPEGYWPEIEKICRKYDILFWSDEVICGFGRTGNWFGCETYGVAPDIMTMAKGMTSGYQPLSAVALSERVARPIIESNSEMAHGYTYSGHPVACAVAIRNIELISEMGLVGPRGAAAAKRFQAGLKALEDHPLVGETRGVGLLGAVELVKNKETRERYSASGATGVICRGHCFDSGVVMRAVGETMFLCPPLVISDAEIDELFVRVRKALDLTLRDLKKG
ncbi:MAG: aminotransferase class III-fold pyridoxal phosphate-dependent enzyme [Parvularculaceae bacterium]|nr:aminotransferase class III-fold pyridoxal phosphate-dependent enzyme [Parvularculaceae bacterium]